MVFSSGGANGEKGSSGTVRRCFSAKQLANEFAARSGERGWPSSFVRHAAVKRRGKTSLHSLFPQSGALVIWPRAQNLRASSSSRKVAISSRRTCRAAVSGEPVLSKSAAEDILAISSGGIRWRLIFLRRRWGSDANTASTVRRKREWWAAAWAEAGSRFAGFEAISRSLVTTGHSTLSQAIWGHRWRSICGRKDVGHTST